MFSNYFISRFASWLYDLKTINFTTITNWQIQKNDSDSNAFDTKIDLSNYLDNSGWILMDVDFIRRER